MFGIFNNDNMVWFYAVPVLFFGPIFFAVLWNFGLKTLFKPDLVLKERQRLEREQLDRVNKRRESKAGSYVRSTHPATKPSILWVYQGVFYGGFMAALAVFSTYPPYTYSDKDKAQIKLSISHPGQHVEECRKRTSEELAKLPPNMRAKMSCGRERVAVHVEMELDGKKMFSNTSKPAGLRKDGSSSFYEKFIVDAGPHVLVLRMNDSPDPDAITATLEREVHLSPAQNLVISYREDGSGFFTK